LPPAQTRRLAHRHGGRSLSALPPSRRDGLIIFLILPSPSWAGRRYLTALRQYLDGIYNPRLPSSVPNGLIQVTKVGVRDAETDAQGRPGGRAGRRAGDDG